MMVFECVFLAKIWKGLLLLVLKSAVELKEELKIRRRIKKGCQQILVYTRKSRNMGSKNLGIWDFNRIRKRATVNGKRKDFVCGFWLKLNSWRWNWEENKWEDPTPGEKWSVTLHKLVRCWNIANVYCYYNKSINTQKN